MQIISNRLALVLSLGLLLGTTSQALAAAPEDVAIDPITGDTFVIEKSQNPHGTLLILNDHDENFKQTLDLLDTPSDNAKFEVKLNESGNLTYLVSVDGLWMMGSVKKTDKGWAKTSLRKAISGQGEAQGLAALPDGRVGVTVSSNEAPDGEILLVNTPVQTGSNYQVIEKIPAAVIENSVNQVVAEMAAKPESENTGSGHGLGFAAGVEAGVGIAYRRHFENKWGMQLAGIAFGSSSSVNANFGATILRTLAKTQIVRFYALAGVSAFYSGNNNQTYAPCPISYDPYGNPIKDPNSTCGNEPATSTWNNNWMLNFGMGIGIEFTIAKTIGLAIELPVTVSFQTEQGNLKFNYVYPIPSAALIYYF
ncbi:hypothetical protein WDW86_08685 [Bdellovibrionota bacterium FG-2]